MTCDCFTRINELTILNEKLKIQIQEKDKTVGTLQRTVTTLERSSRPPSAIGGFEDQVRFEYFIRYAWCTATKPQKL